VRKRKSEVDLERKPKAVKYKSEDSGFFKKAGDFLGSPHFKENLQKLDAKIKGKIKDSSQLSDPNKIDKHPTQEIYTYIQQGNLSELKLMESAVFELKTKDYPFCPSQLSPLAWACAVGQLSIVHYLLTNPRLMQVSLEELEIAIRGGDRDILNALFNHTPDMLIVVKQSEDEYSPFERSCLCSIHYMAAILSSGSISSLEFLFEKILSLGNKSLLLQYLIFLDLLGGFSVSVLLSPYKEQVNAILEIYSEEERLLNFVFHWGRKEFLNDLAQRYPENFEAKEDDTQEINTNILCLTITYERDWEFFEAVVKLNPASVYQRSYYGHDDDFNSVTTRDAEYPIETAARKGRLEIVKYLKDRESKRLLNKSGPHKNEQSIKKHFGYENIMRLAGEYGHDHFFDYFKQNIPDFKKYAQIIIPNLKNWGIGQYKILRYFDDIKTWEDPKKRNFLHLASQKKHLDVETVHWLTCQYPKEAWWVKDSKGDTPLDLAWDKNSKAMIYYSFAWGPFPSKILHGHEITLNGKPAKVFSYGLVMSARNEFLESLSECLSQYFSIYYSPRYGGKLPIHLMNAIFSYLIDQKSCARALLVGFEQDYQKLFRKMIPSIYGPTYQARTGLLAPMHEDKQEAMAREEELHAAARVEAEIIADLAKHTLPPSEQKKVNIEGQKIALYTWHMERQSWPTQAESRKKALSIAHAWHQAIQSKGAPHPRRLLTQ
jgi:ankyrin repeat protein